MLSFCEWFFLTKPFLQPKFAPDFYSDTLQAGLRTLKIESKSTYLRMKTLSGMNRNPEGRRPDGLQDSAFPFNDMNGLSSCTPLPLRLLLILALNLSASPPQKPPRLFRTSGRVQPLLNIIRNAAATDITEEWSTNPTNRRAADLRAIRPGATHKSLTAVQ